MEKLSEADELIVTEFRIALERTVTVDDMFPPEDGVREPVLPNRPNAPAAVMCSLELAIV